MTQKPTREAVEAMIARLEKCGRNTAFVRADELLEAAAVFRSSLDAADAPVSREPTEAMLHRAYQVCDDFIDAHGDGTASNLDDGQWIDMLAAVWRAWNAAPPTESAIAPPEPTKETKMKEVIDRFLAWKLPADFGPDCGISFDGRGKDARGYDKRGQCLSTA